MIDAAFQGTRYHACFLELLEDAECTVDATGDGLLIHRPVAGTLNVIKLELALGDFMHRLPSARLVVAEVPDDVPFREMTTALLSNGFREEGRVADFIAEGIAMRFLVRRES